MSDIKLNSKLLVLSFIIINLIFMFISFVESNLFSSFVEFSSLVRYACAYGYLFLPGFMVLCLLDLQVNRNFIDLVLLSLGFSILFTTFVCLVDNSLLPILSILPIQKIILCPSVLISVILVSIFFMKKKTVYINIPCRYITYVIFGFIILIFSIIGTLILTKTNIGIIISFLLIMSILVLSLRYLPKDVYPFMLWIISLSLVLYNSLFGMYMRPTDNIFEIFVIKKFVLKPKIWNNLAPDNILAMPNVVLFISFLSFFVGNLIYVYKFVLPVIASFIPIIVYRISDLKCGSKVAFCSGLYYSFMFSYITWNSITAKMVTAAVYLALIAMLMFLFDDVTNTSTRLTLLLFSISLVFSHYGTAAILSLILILVYFSSVVLNLTKYKIKELRKFKSYVILYLIVYVLIYYAYSLYVTDGSIFSSVITTIYTTVTGITSMFSPKNYGSKIVISCVPMYLQVLKILYIFSFTLIIIGLLSEIINKLRNMKYIDLYDLISIFFASFLVIPYVFPSEYGSGRIWFISMIFLSPFLITGFKRICQFFRLENKDIYFNLAIIFLIIFFIFNSGFASECIWKYNVGPSIYISYPRITKNGSLWEKEYLDRVYLYVTNIYSAFWLRNYVDVTKKIYLGENNLKNLNIAGFNRYRPGMVGSLSILVGLSGKNMIPNGNYFYVSRFNSKTGKIKVGGALKPILVNIRSVVNLNKFSRIYTNKYSEVYLT